MAAASNATGPLGISLAPSNPGGHFFKEFEQPPVKERLTQAKNFLADEDPDRYLHFEEKITEIEDYIEFVDKNKGTTNLNGDVDEVLLKDVKAMVAAHHDWQKRQKAPGPALTDPNDPDALPPRSFSTRLVSAETKMLVEQEKEELGLTFQTREEGAVFSANAEADHADFLMEMRKAVAQDPSQLDTDTNLAWIESRAYGWALNDPALISHWTHPTRGIPNKGIRLGDERPWYQKPVRALTAAAKRRPAKGWLPDYLVEREARINKLLRLSTYSRAEYAELEKLLSFHEPSELNKLHMHFLNESVKRAYGFPVPEEEINKASDEFQEAFTAWLATFQADGVQLMVRFRGSDDVESNEPGVFYVDDGSLDEDRQAIIDQANDLLRKFRQRGVGGAKGLTPDEDNALTFFLRKSLPPEIARKLTRKSQLVRARNDALNDEIKVLDDEIKELETERRAALRNGTGEFHYIEPGRMWDIDADDLYLEWHHNIPPYKIDTTIGAKPEPIPEQTNVVASIERLINDAFRNGESPDLENGNPTFILLLQQVAYPDLRALLIPFLFLRTKEAYTTLPDSERRLMSVIRPEVNRLWNNWIEGFITKRGVPEKVRVLMPFNEIQAERPDVIHCRSMDPLHNMGECLKAARAAYDLLAQDTTRMNPEQFLNLTKELNRVWPQEHRYPALVEPLSDSPDDEHFRFEQWMISKLQPKNGLTVLWREGSVLFDKRQYGDPVPEDDPTVVYYRGILPTLELLNEYLSDEAEDKIISTDFNPGNINESNSFDLLYSMRYKLHPIFWSVFDGISPGDSLPRTSTEPFRALMNWYIHAVKNDYVEVDFGLDRHARSQFENEADGVDDQNLVISPFDQKRAALDREGIIEAQNSGRMQEWVQPKAPWEESRSLVRLRVQSRPPATPLTRTALQQHIYDSDRYMYIATAQDKERGRLISVGKLAKTIEIDVNRLLHIVNDTSLSTGTEQQSPIQDAAWARLYALLPQFMPPTIYGRWKRYLVLQRRLSQGDFTAVMDDILVAKVANLYAEYNQAIVPWLNALRQNKVTILLPGDVSLPRQGRVYRGDVLVKELRFQKRAFRNRGTETETMEIIAPSVEQAYYRDERLIASSSVTTYSLKRWRSDSSSSRTRPQPEVAAVLGLPKVDVIQSKEDMINSLLAKRHNLDWDESEKLITSLRLIMPIDLIHQDEHLLSVDNAARVASSLSPEETTDFWNAWEQWQLDYGTWLAKLPDRIHIDRGTREDSVFQESVRFIPNTLIIPRATRGRSLPRPVVEINEELNNILKDPGNITSISDDIWTFLRTGLRPLFRQTSDGFRRLLDAKIKAEFCSDSKTASEVVLDPEDRVLIEVIYDVAYVRFLCALSVESTSSSPTIQVTEQTPGLLSIEYIGGKPLHELTPDAEKLLSLVWLEGEGSSVDLTTHRKCFHDLADMIRNNVPLTPVDLSFVQERLVPLPERMEIFVQLRELLLLLESDPNQFLQADAYNNYEELETRILWYRWYYDYPELAKKVNPRQQFIDPARDLVTRRWAGSTREPPGVPRIAVPSQFEVSSVEVEINNLLVRARNGVAGDSERMELDYLLIGLTPPKLREAKSILDSRETKYLNIGGLNARETIEFLGREKSFEKMFAKFKEDLPKHHVILDYNWYTLQVISETVSRARLWKEYTRNPDGTYIYPTTSDDFEDENQREWHRQYRLLEANVNEIWVNNDTLQKQFFWSEMPQELRHYKQSIEHPLKHNFNDALSNSTNALVVRSKFIHHYMQWLAQNSASVMLQWRAQAGVYQGYYDFTTKAERRGIQRASIELALNHLATNQEQHRPSDRFRVLNITGQQYRKPQEPVRLSLPLEPWKRPLEMDTFNYTKALAKLHQRNDEAYKSAREKTLAKKSKFIDPPANYLGPFALADGDTYREGARKRQVDLAGIAYVMQEAQLKAPRPLMQELVAQFTQGLDPVQGPLWDDVLLTQPDLDLLAELSQDSWDELKIAYPENLVTGERKSLLDKFEREVKVLKHEIPPWTSSAPVTASFDQIVYSPTAPSSTPGLTKSRLLLILNERRLNHDPPFHAWSHADANEFLQYMHDHRRIHLEGSRLSTIPLTGHPENKYVTQRVGPPPQPNEPQRPLPPGVKFGAHGAEVRYDKSGTTGPPILQTNKIEHLRRLGYRLGRDCRECLSILASDYVPTQECLKEQGSLLKSSLENMPTTDAQAPDHQFSDLKKMALELHEIAPDLADHAQMIFEDHEPTKMTEAQAGQLVQMQVLEEISNNWELRFPENEHVWDFAEDRLKNVEKKINGRKVLVKPRPRQFFDMRRWPVSLQSKQIQQAIIESGPIIQEKPEPPVVPQLLTRAQLQRQAAAANKQPPKKDRHIRGQRPSFPFGETPYQAAYQSFRMDQDLADVPEFQIPERGIGERVRRLPVVRHIPVIGKKDDPDDLPPPDRFALPNVPPDWQPDNISKAAAAAAIIESAKRTPGMPDPSIPENYHTQPEIDGLACQENWDRHVQEVAIANKAIEELTGKKIKDLTAAERNQACIDLRIDLALGKFIRPQQQQQPQGRGRGWWSRTSGPGSGAGDGRGAEVPGSGMAQSRRQRSTNQGQRGLVNLRPRRLRETSQAATQESQSIDIAPTEPPNNGSDPSERAGSARSQSPTTSEGRVVGGFAPDEKTQQEQGVLAGARGTRGQALTPAGARALERSMALRPGIKRRGSRKRGPPRDDGGDRGGKRVRGV